MRLVRERDGMDVQLHVGLNPGQVIAGEVGSGAGGYTTIGEQVGMAQRRESVAPPGGVMLSASTARLAETAAILGEFQMLHIKSSAEAVPARQLLTVAVQDGRITGRLVLAEPDTFPAERLTAFADHFIATHFGHAE